MRNPVPLRSARDFRRVITTGARGRARGLTVVAAPRREGAAPGRLGMEVRTTSGTAVERNRIKRRIRAAFVVVAPPGLDVVVRAGSDAGQEEFHDLVNDLRIALTRAGSPR